MKTKTFIVTVSDTVTYRRTVEITVDAKSKDEAMALALDQADDAMGSEFGQNDTVTEEQIDNTPYDVIAVRT